MDDALSGLLNLHDFEAAAARQRLEPLAWHYTAGGSEDETSLGDLIADEVSETPYDAASEAMLKRDVNEALDRLTGTPDEGRPDACARVMIGMCRSSYVGPDQPVVFYQYADSDKAEGPWGTRRGPRRSNSPGSGGRSTPPVCTHHPRLRWRGWR